jgi:hypothetical protein
MPASQSANVTQHGFVEVSIDPIDEPEDVYFTEQRPQFEIVIENKSDREVKSRDGNRFTGLVWAVELGSDQAKTLASGEIDFSLQPDETHRELIDLGLLGYEGNAVISVGGASVSGHNKDTGPITIGTSTGSSGTSEVLYTFPIWDRSHYDTVHEQPKRLQKVIILFGALAAGFSAFQIAIELGLIN